MNEMAFVVLVFICEWLYVWSILLEEDEDADSGATDMHGIVTVAAKITLR